MHAHLIQLSRSTKHVTLGSSWRQLADIRERDVGRIWIACGEGWREGGTEGGGVHQMHVDSIPPSPLSWQPWTLFGEAVWAHLYIFRSICDVFGSTMHLELIC